jgi:hypothetical protein
MGWDHIARQKRLAPIGEYRPKVYRVTVHDTFDQLRLQAAAQAIENGMSVSDFFRFSAYYVRLHHRELRGVRRVFNKGARDILSAVQEPIPAEFTDPESERDRRRRDALRRFQEWVWPELNRMGGR